jgi:2-polyprenyl-6-methoxyphenol hydroxylase-like FAD-dependent oxidoreductase
MPPPGRFHGNHALVIGASISGLLAARVLSAHFDRVTVLDRDVLPPEPAQRSGTPQGRHGHGLLASGLQGLKALFPLLERDLLRAGAVQGDLVENIRWFQHRRYKARFHSGIEGLFLSRPLLETTIRQQLLEISNVRIIDRTRAVGLLGDGRRVVGVRSQQVGESIRSVLADFVVDASGRLSRSGEWIEALGFRAPPLEEVAVDIGYTTRTFRRLPTHLKGDLGVVLAPAPPRQTRLGFMLALEGDRWIVGLGGRRGDHAPADPQGFLAFAHSLRRPDIYEVVRHAEPLTEPSYIRFPSNLRRRYERLTRFPAAYLVIGDALCSFNPLYGQGMSVAILEALALQESLSGHASLATLWQSFFKQVSRIVSAPWTIAAGGDLAFNGTGPVTPRTEAMNWYLSHVHHAASKDRVVCQRFFEVANLLQPTAALFHPSIAARVFRACLWPERRRSSPRGSSQRVDTKTHSAIGTA